MKTEKKDVKGKDMLGSQFTVSAEFQIAETPEEAIQGNAKAKGLGQASADKLIMSKFLTNQMDKVRNDAIERRDKAIKEGLKNADPKKMDQASKLLGLDLKALLGL